MMRVILSALLASAAACASPAFAETIMLHAGRVITDASQPSTGPATITVTDGKITAITPGYIEAPAGAKLVNLRDKTVLPGLIDLHVHLQSNPGGDYRDEAVVSDDFATLVGARNALRTVKAGFTTVRDMGSTPLGGFALREATALGLIPGPRII
jgi:imidazolonepropionase-like amidohydrolase